MTKMVFGAVWRGAGSVVLFGSVGLVVALVAGLVTFNIASTLAGSDDRLGADLRAAVGLSLAGETERAK